MPAYCIEETHQTGTAAVSNREPTPGKWYAGINAHGQVGTVAKWDGYQFGNSQGDNLDMTKYVYLKERP